MSAMFDRFKAVLIAIAASVLVMTSASAQQFTMKLSSPTINDVVHEYYKTLKAGVEARAGGRLKLEIYPANQLGQLPAVVEGVALGTIEAGKLADLLVINGDPVKDITVLQDRANLDVVMKGGKFIECQLTPGKAVAKAA